MNQRLEILQRMLDQNQSQKAEKLVKTTVNKDKLRKEINSKAPDLHARIGKFQELLQHESIGGKIDLGSDVTAINWSAMPEELVNCFKPEFDYQPEEITEFAIVSKSDSVPDGKTVGIELRRNDQWWSYVYAGSIVRKNEKLGFSFISCQSDQGQPKAARQGMRYLNDSLWQHDLTQDSTDSQLPQLVHDVNELRFAESVLEFALGELEQRVLPQPTT